ncbi:MAG: GNAT family N-acetyltransferase [Conexibacteraceae bacterium]|nr:GNAT family N-acetyltransferase [Conexibacteraceae bacterium]
MPADGGDRGDEAAAAVAVRPAREDELDELHARLRAEWFGDVIVSRGVAHELSDLSVLVALDGASVAGLATYIVSGGECELVTLNAFKQSRGIGGALLEAVADAARDAGCRRLWLTTTNDNLTAQRFYERRGLRLATIHRAAVDDARRLKPSIPLVGEHGIEIHDELEYELLLL